MVVVQISERATLISESSSFQKPRIVQVSGAGGYRGVCLGENDFTSRYPHVNVESEMSRISSEKGIYPLLNLVGDCHRQCQTLKMYGLYATAQIEPYNKGIRDAQQCHYPEKYAWLYWACPNHRYRERQDKQPNVPHSSLSGRILSGNKMSTEIRLYIRHISDNCGVQHRL